MHVDLDVDGPRERRRLEIGRQRQLVAPGEDGAGQAVRVRLVGHGAAGYPRARSRAGLSAATK